MMLDRLFVYGTLMRGYDHPMARLVSDNADFIGAATIPGRLYLIRHYPGLVPSEDRADVVHGEAFRLHRPHEILAALDDYEGCGDGAVAPEYRRVTASLRIDGGTAQHAWTYLYIHDVTRLPRIVSGRFEWKGSS
jgi:gamma-glutamylcyclotransferase (GGCT)/AIG2-like uncharacterized protein YtfP